MSPDYIARCASLAMVLEVSATPKPGNVDREHDYPDTRYEHFLASAVAVYSTLREAASQKQSVGALLKKAVEESNQWQRGGNTHFGAFLLLIPLSMGRGDLEKAHRIVRNTSVDDAVYFYQAFKKASVNVTEVDKLSLKDDDSIVQLQKEGKTLYQLMQIAENYDEIAIEWTQCFPLTRKAHNILNRHTRTAGISEAIVRTYLEILKEHPDTFIQTKHDKQTSMKTSQDAAILVEKIEQHGYNNTLAEIHAFGDRLLSQKINPGSTADIMIAGLFLLLLGGYRF